MAGTWDSFVEEALLGRWLDEYDERTPWPSTVLEIQQKGLTYLFDGAPTLAELGYGDDRVVAVWGESHHAVAGRDSSRQAGFIPLPSIWSGAGRDRGHFVAHAAGGGLDMNLFPQRSGLNRGLTEQGKTWKAMEHYAAAHPGSPLFVRPLYDDATWTPLAIEYGLWTDGELWFERFDNRE